MAESLSQKQQRFTRYVGQLIEFAYQMGYGLTFGEAYRTKEQAALNAASGAGISNSLHTERLAIDFNLFKGGKYLTKTEDYRELGEFWKSLSPDCAWGGDFIRRKDGNHFSLQHQGRK